jgi:hypothetical protein
MRILAKNHGTALLELPPAGVNRRLHYVGTRQSNRSVEIAAIEPTTPPQEGKVSLLATFIVVSVKKAISFASIDSSKSPRRLTKRVTPVLGVCRFIRADERKIRSYVKTVVVIPYSSRDFRLNRQTPRTDATRLCLRHLDSKATAATREENLGRGF